jgi:membrane protein implicated in regulation of membrane protease activity
MSSEILWLIWAVLGVILIIAEVFTPGFVLLWFGIGALCASLAALVGISSLTLQFLLFAFVSIALTVASRTIFVSYTDRWRNGVALRTGVESLPGQVGTVVSSSTGALHEGAVKVFGSVWTAYPADGEAPLETGDRVVVESVKGASITVRRAGALPPWRASENGNDR